MERTKVAAEPGASEKAAQQTRSRRTEGKLLAAAGRVLDRDGLDAATAPRIAAEAKLSPASIYRRFADKDDLLRAALLHMLRSLNAGNAANVRSLLARESLAETAGALVGLLLKQYRQHPRLRRALDRLLETNPDSPFAKDAERLIASNIQTLSEALLKHRDSIRHVDPERAARFAVLSASSAIEMAAPDGGRVWRMVLPLSDKTFAAELTRQMVAYLRRKP